MTLEHIGIAVRGAEEAVELFSALLGARPYKVESVEREGVRTHFFGDAGAAGRAPKIELLEVSDPTSPVVKFLERRGPGLHHVAFEVDDLDAAVVRLREAGFEPVSDTPAPGADGKRVTFLHPRSAGGVLVELCESAPPAESLEVPVAEGTISAFVSGPADGEPLMMLHGALGTTAMETARLARRWAADFRVIAVDFRGHGASAGFTSTPLSVQTFTEDVVSVLDAAGASHAHVFGFSLGAAVALHLALKHPDRVRRVVTLGANVRWVDDEAKKMTAAMCAALDAPDGRWARKLAECHGADHWRDLTERTIAFTRRLPSTPFSEDALRSISAPTLVAHGDRDRYFDVRHAVHLRRTLRDAHLWVIPGADHPIRKLDARTFATEVASFLRR